MKRTHVVEVSDGLLWDEPNAGAREECEESSRWRERSDSVWWTDYSTHSSSPCAAGKAVQVEKIGSEGEPKKKGGVKEGVFKIYFLFVIILLWFDWL